MANKPWIWVLLMQEESGGRLSDEHLLNGEMKLKVQLLVRKVDVTALP